MGLFHGIEICALQILNERQGQQGTIIDVSHHGRNVCPAKSCGGTKAAFSGDELIAGSMWTRANRYRLEQPALLEARLEFCELFRTEFLARLVRIGTDLRDRDSLNRFLCRSRCGFARGLFCWYGPGREQCFEPAAKPAWLVSRHRS